MLSEKEKKAIDILQNQIADYIIGNYCAKCGDFTICENKDEDCYYIQAIDTVLNIITKLQKENEEKDKQIDYIIDFIRERSIYAVDTHEKLKQYFAGLVEKE